MNSFYEHHKDSIHWHYRCFDRILLNGLIQPFQQAERGVGFFNTYRQLYPVTRYTLRDIADQFQRWVTERAEKRSIPIVEAPKGRRDEFVDPYFERAKPDAIVAILKAREPARIMTAIGDKVANRWHLQFAQRWVIQYNFYINDRNWGRMFVRVCPYLPFSARICLNQHHWLANRMREKGIRFKQTPNSFLKCVAPDRLQELANSLTPRDLVSCGQKWLAHLTPFFTAREREHAGCQHRLFFSQVEYCDNLIFRRRAALDNLGQRLLDANRTIGQPNKITVVFGRKVSKQYRGKLQTEIEDMDLPNPVIRSHYRNGFIKQYVRDHLILRTEAASNNVNDYGVKKAVENLPVLKKALSAINDNYLNVQQDILETFVDRGQLRKLAEPTITSTGKRIPGFKLDSPSATRPHACTGTLRTHRSRQYLHHRRNPSPRHRSARLHPRTLHARLAALRSLETPRQRPRCQAPELSQLSTPPAGLLDLPRLPEALRTRLCPSHRRPSQPHQSRCTARIPKAISTRSPLSARHRRSRYPRPSRRPQSRVTPSSNENKIHATGAITA